MLKKPRLNVFKIINTVFVAIVFVGIITSAASIFYPEKLQQIEQLIMPQQEKKQQGVLGDLIAQVVASPTPSSTPTPAPPTSTPTPTPIPTAVLSGTIYVDANANGNKDTLEAGVSGVTVTITGASSTTTTTSLTGGYSVTLPRGDYTVTITVPNGYKNTSTNPQSVSLTSNKTVNFGIGFVHTLSGNVFTDTDIDTTKDAGESGNSGITVSVSGPTSTSTTTDENGDFTFPALFAGTYTVTIAVPGGYKATNTNPRSVTLNSNQSVSFGVAQYYTVSGMIFLDNNRNSVDDNGDGNYTGGTITFTGPTTVTARSASDGSYTAQLFAGTYNAEFPLPANYQASTPSEANFTVGPNRTLNFGIVPLFTISGAIFEDKNEDGKRGNGDSVEPGVTIVLSGTATGSAVTDNSGNFSFPNLFAGTYTITYTLPAKKKSTTTNTQTITFAPPSTAGTAGGTPAKTVEFGMVTLYNVTGKVFIDLNKNGLLDPSEPLYQGATVTLTKTTPVTKTTDVSGGYLFADQASGDYTIRVDTPTGYRSTTANSLNFPLSTDKTVNFGIVESTTTKVGGSCSANGVDIMLVFDDSGSMQETDPTTGMTKMLAAKRAASSFIDIVSSHVKNAQYGLTVFSGSNNYPNDVNTRVSQPLTTNTSAIKNAISAVPDNGGGTCVECGIVLGNGELSRSTRNAQKVVIVMTDGATNQIIGSNGGNVSIDAAENAAMTATINGVNAQNIIYQVIGIGQGSGSFDPIFMQQLADTNGGRFYNSPSTSTLESIYQSIAEDIGTGVVNGMIFNDKNTNKVYDGGDLPLYNWTVQASAEDLDVPITAKTNSAGQFSFTGLCTKDFTFTEVVQAGWYQTTDTKAYNLSVESGNSYDNIDFGNATGFTISGNIVKDFDKDLNLAPPDTLITDPMLIFFSGPTRKTVETSNGSYSSGALPPGTYTVSLVSPLTTGYRMTYPLNGPPPSFQVTLGPECNTNGATGAKCE